MNFEIIIPEQYESLLVKEAERQGISVEELLAKILRHYLERTRKNYGN